jgi:SpoVK/Ycf46/Vps4 family AAA+-type ATPase
MDNQRQENQGRTRSSPPTPLHGLAPVRATGHGVPSSGGPNRNSHPLLVPSSAVNIDPAHPKLVLALPELEQALRQIFPASPSQSGERSYLESQAIALPADPAKLLKLTPQISGQFECQIIHTVFGLCVEVGFPSALRSEFDYESYKEFLQHLQSKALEAFPDLNRGQLGIEVLMGARISVTKEAIRRALSGPPGAFDTLMDQWMRLASAVAEGALQAFSHTFADGGERLALPAVTIKKHKKEREGAEKQAGMETFQLADYRYQGAKTCLADIGGNPELKKQLSEIVQILRHKEHFKKFGTNPPKGVLLYGPPGTGKTLGARALVGELERQGEEQGQEIPFYVVKSSDILSMWHGASEKNIAAMGAQLRESAQEHGFAVLFLDELEAIGLKRGGAGTSGVHDRMVTELLQFLDGIEGAGNILVLGATNRSESLDDALLRSGRFDRKIFVDTPDVKAREQIFDIHLKHAASRATIDLGLGQVNRAELAKASAGLVGADIEEAIKRCISREAMDTLKVAAPPKFTIDKFKAAIEAVSNEKQKRAPVSAASDWTTGRKYEGDSFNASDN